MQKVNPAVGETIFVYDVFGNLAAEYGAGSGATCGPCYVFADPVGSVRLVVDQNEAVVKRYDRLPFGEAIRAGDGWANGRTGTAYAAGAGVKFGFGGSYVDEESGEWAVDVMGARQYRPGYGRFVTPDENLVDQEAGDPVSWNLYGYGRNNPLRYWDPTGRCSQGEDGRGHDDDDGKCLDVTSVEVTAKAPSVRKAVGASLLLFEMTMNVPNAMAERTFEAALDWMSRPRDPGCMAGYAAAGSIGGFWAGGGAGTFVGFAGWGAPMLATVPAGAAAGAAAGGALGGVAGLVMCSSGTGGGGGGGGGEGATVGGKPPVKATKLKGSQGWRDASGNIRKKDMLHKDHWDVTDRTGRKIKEVDFHGREIWPNGPKNAAAK